jgi:hypothetical protein
LAWKGLILKSISETYNISKDLQKIINVKFLSGKACCEGQNGRKREFFEKKIRSKSIFSLRRSIMLGFSPRSTVYFLTFICCHNKNL